MPRFRRLLVVLPALCWIPLLQAQPQDPPTAEPALEAVSAAEAMPLPIEFEWLRAPGFETVVCPFREAIDYKPGEVECGLIKVPENRERPGSRTIELLFVKINATGKDEDDEPVETRDDPVLYLTGGPGVTVDGYVARLKDHGLVRQRDLYILEQRGIGNSGDFCPFWGGRSRADRVADNYDDAQRGELADGRACVQRARDAGVDVTGYHTFENARDVRALRLALGLDTWNIWGISYGSVLGQAVLEVDAEGVRAMVIDAIVPLDLKDLMRLPHWYARMLDRFFSACKEQSGCARAWPDLEQRYRAAIQTVLDAPVEVEVPAGEIYPDGRAWVFQDVIAGIPFGMVYEEKTHAAIPALIDGLARQVERGNTDFFRAIAMASGGMGIDVSMGMSAAVRCLDGYTERNAEALAQDLAEHPLYTRAFGGETFPAEAAALCRELGLGPRDPAQFEIRDTRVPLLIANGAWDPITPPPLAEYVAERIPSARYVEFPHAGHGPTRSVKCAGEFLNSFFDDPSAALDMDCVENGGEAADYVSRYLATDALQQALILAEEDEKQLVPHLVWLGVSLLLVLAGALIVPLAALGRRIDRRRVARAGRARLWTGLAAIAAVLYVAALGVSGALTAKTAAPMLLVGLLGPAWWTAWLGPVAVILGLIALQRIFKLRQALGRSALIGLMPVALAAVSVGVFGLVWGLWPLGML